MKIQGDEQNTKHKTILSVLCIAACWVIVVTHIPLQVLACTKVEVEIEIGFEVLILPFTIPNFIVTVVILVMCNFNCVSQSRLQTLESRL